MVSCMERENDLRLGKIYIEGSIDGEILVNGNIQQDTVVYNSFSREFIMPQGLTGVEFEAKSEVENNLLIIYFYINNQLVLATEGYNTVNSGRIF